MTLYTSLQRPLLLALACGDTERAHAIALYILEQFRDNGEWLANFRERQMRGISSRPVYVRSVKFPNALGLAAGVDKDGRCLPYWESAGFGFVEVGTVLPRPQAGNPKPRIFRLPQQEALINRLGFNSAGAETIAENLDRMYLHSGMQVGISAGKMKDTPLEEAADDHKRVMDRLKPYASYWAHNISSPNTPGLRELQEGKYLENFVLALVRHEETLARAANRPLKPTFIKIAPDLKVKQVDEISDTIFGCGADGIIIANTTVTRPNKEQLGRKGKQEGGLSGASLFNISFPIAQRVRRRHPGWKILYTGGVNSPERARRALDVADLVAMNTAFGYQGPPLVRAVLQSISASA